MSYEVIEPFPTSRAEQAAYITDLLSTGETEYNEHAAYLYEHAISSLEKDETPSDDWDELHGNLTLAAFAAGDSELATASLTAIEDPTKIWESYAKAKRYSKDVLSVEAGVLLGEALPQIEAIDDDKSELSVRLAQLEINLLDYGKASQNELSELESLWLHLGRSKDGLYFTLSRLFAEAGDMKSAKRYYELLSSTADRYQRSQHEELLKLHKSRLAKHNFGKRISDADARFEHKSPIDERLLAWGGKDYSEEVLRRSHSLRPHDFFARYNPRALVIIEQGFERQGADVETLYTLLRGGALPRAREVYKDIITATPFNARLGDIRPMEMEQAAAALLMSTYDNGIDVADATLSQVTGGHASLVNGAVNHLDTRIHGSERRTELTTIDHTLTSGLEALPTLPMTARRLNAALALAQMATNAYGSESITKHGQAAKVGVAVQEAWKTVAYTTPIEDIQRLGHLAMIKDLGIVVSADPRADAHRGYDILYGRLSHELKQEWGGDRLDRALRRMYDAS